MGVLDFALDEEEVAAEAGKGPAEKPEDSKPKLPPEVQKLIEKNNLLEQQMKSVIEENKGLKEKVAVVDKLEGVFKPPAQDDDEYELPEDLKDPVYDARKVIKHSRKIIDEEVDRKVNERIGPFLMSQSVRAAQQEIEKDFELVLDGERVSWEDPRVQKKLKPHLDDFDSGVKVRNPKRVLQKSAAYAGLLKRRDASELPSYEEGAPRLTAKQKEDFAKREKEAIKKAGAPRLFNFS